MSVRSRSMFMISLISPVLIRMSSQSLRATCRSTGSAPFRYRPESHQYISPLMSVSMCIFSIMCSAMRYVLRFSDLVAALPSCCISGCTTILKYRSASRMLRPNSTSPKGGSQVLLISSSIRMASCSVLPITRFFMYKLFCLILRSP